MRTGEPVSAAPGRTSDKVLALHAMLVMGSIRADVEPHPNYRHRNYAMFVNGLWRTNAFIASDTESVRIIHPIDPGSTDVSLAVVEVGDHEQFDESWYVPGGWIREEETADAARIRIQWTAGYLIDEVNGENSLSSMILTGINRFSNCEPDDKFPTTRARIWYTIETPTGTDHVVRLWANKGLLCSGAITGDGLVTFTANNDSGVTGQCLLTYSVDIAPEEYFVVLRWAAAYNVHYSTAPLVYPRSPEMVIYDRTVSQYVCLTPILPAGSYNYSVQAVGDDNTLQSPVATPADSPKVIKTPPLPITFVNATGNWAQIRVNYTAGEPFCSYTVYSSLVDEPVNLGQWPLPVPINRPVGSSFVNLAPVANWAPLDRTASWMAFYNTLDDVVANMNAAYDAGYTGFVATLDYQATRAQNALQSLSNATGIPTTEHSEAMALLFEQLRGMAVLGSAMTLSEFKLWIYSPMSKYLIGISSVVEGTNGRYSFSDGSQPYALPGNVLSDGVAGSNVAGGISNRTSVWDLVHPLVTNRIVRVIIRSTRLSDSIQEVNDEVYEIELDSNGDVVNPRPNSAYIVNMSSTDLTVTFGLQSRTDDQLVAADTLKMFYSVAPADINYALVKGSVAASGDITGVVSGNVVITFPAPGFYRIGARAVSAAGVQSASSAETTIWVGTEQPAGPTNILAQVIRSQPDTPPEDA
jgi:hypothetical protein